MFGNGIVGSTIFLGGQLEYLGGHLPPCAPPWIKPCHQSSPESTVQVLHLLLIKRSTSTSYSCTRAILERLLGMDDARASRHA